MFGLLGITNRGGLVSYDTIEGISALLNDFSVLYSTNSILWVSVDVRSATFGTLRQASEGRMRYPCPLFATGGCFESTVIAGGSLGFCGRHIYS